MRYPQQPKYEQMMIGVYDILGILLLWASRQTKAHLSLIWVTLWSSLVHGTIMGIVAGAERAHLWGEVAALGVAVLLLGWLNPRGIGQQEECGRGLSTSAMNKPSGFLHHSTTQKNPI